MGQVGFTTKQQSAGKRGHVVEYGILKSSLKKKMTKWTWETWQE